MLTFSGIFTFLYINTLTRYVSCLYQYNPNIQYYGLENKMGNSTGFLSPKKQITGSLGPRFQKFTNEFVVDSYFKVLKSPSRFGQLALVETNNEKGFGFKTEVQQEGYGLLNNPIYLPPKELEQQISPRSLSIFDKSGSDIKQQNNIQSIPEAITLNPQQNQPPNNAASNIILPTRFKTIIGDFKNSIYQRRKIKDAINDFKPSYIQMNVRRTQIGQEPQKILLIKNTPEMPGGQLADNIVSNREKPYEIVTVDKDNIKNDQDVARMDDLPQLTADNNQRSDYTKRDTDNILINNISKGMPVSVKLKYFAKDKVLDRTETKIGDVDSIGIVSENTEKNYAQNALFYRLSPEIMDKKETFLLTNSIEVDAGEDLIGKTKRFSGDTGKIGRHAIKFNTNINMNHKRMRNYFKLQS